MSTTEVKVEPFGHAFDVHEDETILEAALRNSNT